MTRGMSTFVTLSVLTAILIGGTYLGVRLLTGEAPALPDADAAGSCRNRTLEAGEQLSTNQVSVNVLNAGGRSGLAFRTMKNLEASGFVPGTTSNAPEDTKVKNVLVVAPNPKRVEARLVGAQFKGKVKYAEGSPSDEANVEVYIGTKFAGTKKKPTTTVKAKHRVTLCIPVIPGVTPDS